MREMIATLFKALGIMDDETFQAYFVAGEDQTEYINDPDRLH